MGLFVVLRVLFVLSMTAAHGNSASSDHSETTVSPSLEVRRYSLEGRSIEELSEALRRRREDLGPGSYDGHTEWRLALPPQDENCDPRSIQLDASITVVVPDENLADGLPPPDAAIWRTYVRGLTAHEMRHVEMTTRAIEELQKEINNAENCLRAYSIRRMHNLRIHAINAAYDRETEHGRKEGVIPP